MKNAMKSSLSELVKPGSRASLKEKCICRCYCFWLFGAFVIGVLLIVMGAMKDLTMSGSSDDWSFTWAFDSNGKGLLALTIGCSATFCTLCLCCIPVCWAECARPEIRHAFAQECGKFKRCCGHTFCCCCICCSNCCYLCCERCCHRRRRPSETPNTDYVPKSDPYAIPEVPEMVEMGRPIEMKATAI